MMYYEFSAGGKDYKLRLATRNIVALEKTLGCNPLAIFGDGDTIPTLTVMVNVLHASLQQYHHNVSLMDAYDIFDAWLADGNNMMEFIPVIIEIYKVSGLVKEFGGEQTEKN